MQKYWIFNSTYFEQHLRTTIYENVFMRLRKNKNISLGSFNFIFKKQVEMFLFISWKKQVKMIVFILWLVSFAVCIQMQYFCHMVRNKLQTINIYFPQIISCEGGLSFDQWKTFSKKNKPTRVWLWLVYKFVENYCRLRLFSEFI